MATCLRDLSAILLALQVNFLLCWCFLGLNMMMEVVLYLLPSSSICVWVRTFLVTIWLSPSCQNIWNNHHFTRLSIKSRMWDSHQQQVCRQHWHTPNWSPYPQLPQLHYPTIFQFEYFVLMLFSYLHYKWICRRNIDGKLGIFGSDGSNIFCCSDLTLKESIILQ